MSVSIVVTTHGNPEVTNDTLDSIHTYITKNTLVVVDGKCTIDMPLISHKIIGLRVENNYSPFRNAALGLSYLHELYPDSEWFGYLDYDCLVTSSYILTTLQKAAAANIWVLGNDGHVEYMPIPLVDKILGEPLTKTYYMLGCCQFYHRDFITKLVEIDFFNKFLEITNCYDDDKIRGYRGYDFSEHLYPSLARHFGASVGVMASYFENEWYGSYKHYPMRFRPPLTMDDNFPEASIMHPLKTYDDPIRVFHREKRLWTKKQ